MWLLMTFFALCSDSAARRAAERDYEANMAAIRAEVERVEVRSLLLRGGGRAVRGRGVSRCVHCC